MSADRATTRADLSATPVVELPMALAELHRATPVGGAVAVRVTGDDAAILDAFAGGGFTHVTLSGGATRVVDATRARTLPDTVGAGMRALVCGLNPSLHAADAGVAFVTPSNRFWRAAVEAGLATRARDPWHALRAHGTGMTDLVKRATRRADELTAAEYRDGVARVERLCTRLRPDVIVMVGLAGWRAACDRGAGAGLQERTLGGRPVYVMPSTSGLNASSRLPDLVDHLRAALAVGASSGPDLRG